MEDKQPMQADGSGTEKHAKGPEVASRQGGSGESGGGAYPNPHSSKDGDAKQEDGFLGHGGQTEIAYSGPDNPNSTTKED